MQIKQIIFDFDGVILNSHKIKTKAFYKLFKKYGHKNAKKAVKYHLNNTGVSRFVKFKYILKKIIKIKPQKNILEQLDKEFSDFCEMKIKNLKPSKSLLNFLKLEKKNFIFFISTGTPQKDINKILKRKKINHFFRKAYGSPRKKTSHIKEIKKNGLSTLFIGDSVEDLYSAKVTATQFILKVNSENSKLKNKSINKIYSFRNFKEKVKSISIR
tara:strand:+ start:164 stop:805 length:642 start_codon:yes stop_codon:yes gene_type:complete